MDSDYSSPGQVVSRHGECEESTSNAEEAEDTEERRGREVTLCITVSNAAFLSSRAYPRRRRSLKTAGVDLTSEPSGTVPAPPVIDPLMEGSALVVLASADSVAGAIVGGARRAWPWPPVARAARLVGHRGVRRRATASRRGRDAG